MAGRSVSACEAGQRAAHGFAFGAGRWPCEGDVVIYLGRRFALGDRVLRLARAVGRTSRLSVAGLLAMARELGPYTALAALILPGGSLIALAAWAFRHRTPIAASVGRTFMIGAAFAVALILPVSA